MVNWGVLVTEFSVWAYAFAMSWGYVGVFLVSLLGSATIILPVPSFFIVFALGGVLNPWIVGIVAGAGAAIGELTGYALGLGGGAVINKKFKKNLTKTRKWIEKHGAFPIIVFFAATPLPDDIVGILGGVIKYNLKKFLIASFIGKTIMHMAIAWAGYYGSYMVGGVNEFFSAILIIIFLIVIYNLVFKAIREGRFRIKK